MVEQWIEEVLFRGRPPSGTDSEKPPRFHVVFGVQDDDPLTPEQKVRRTIGPVDATRAAEMGYTPMGLVAEINLQAFQQIETMEADVAAKESRITELEQSNQEKDQAIAALTAEIAKLRAVPA